MKRISIPWFALLLISGVVALAPRAAMANKGALATVAGTVRDSKGNPLAGALITLLKEGAKEAVKHTTGADGKFTVRITPGRYNISAIAQGFNEVVFASVEVRASQELVYRFNLEPVGSGRTLPERRRDREDVRWTLRSAQSRRSIFQIQEGDSEDIKAIAAAAGAEEEEASQNDEIASDARHKARTQAVIESYFAANNAFGPGFIGVNFAVATPASNKVDLIMVGQTGTGPTAPQRFEATGLMRIADRHRVGVTLGGIQLKNWLQEGPNTSQFGQYSVRAIDEWIIRDGVVVVLGLDYSRFIGHGGAKSLRPRLGVQFDANARTRVKAAYAPGGNEGRVLRTADFESKQIAFLDSTTQPIAFVDGRAVMERSQRLEFGIERVLDNESNLEASAFFDTTSGRGVGLLSTPATAFSGPSGAALLSIANQQGGARGMRVVYTRRLSAAWTASTGYSFGRGQRLSPSGITNPAEMFTDGNFQTAALQLEGNLGKGTHVQTVFRFSRDATVFAIDPFAGRLAVYDPSLSIQITQVLPSFGLPVRAEAIIDARNILDAQTATENGESLIQISSTRRSVRGGISVRF